MVTTTAASGDLRERVQKVLRQVNDLPTLPTIYTRVSDLMRNPRVSASDIAEVIGQDQVITAKLLRLVNSVHYGFNVRVSTVGRAISLVGMRALRDLILATSVMDLFKRGKNLSHVQAAGLWQHSLAVACAAQAVARVREELVEEEYFVGGLIHDIGKVVWLEHFPKELDLIVEAMGQRNLSMVEAENEFLGINHSRVGRMLAKQWNLPDRYIEAIAWHHDPRCSEQQAAFASVIHVADSITYALGLGETGPPRVPPILPEAWELTGLTVAHFDQLLQLTEEAYTEALAALSSWDDDDPPAGR